MAVPALSLVCTAPAAAQGEQLVPVGGAFVQPVHVAAAPGDDRRLFVVEQAGRIRVVRDGVVLAQPFLDLTGPVLSGGERGLLSVAFAPDYARSGKLYVYYTSDAGPGNITIEELRRSAANPDRAEPGSRRLLLSIGHSQYGNHNGGQLQFGPDGALYAAPGDGGGGGDPFGSGQSLGTLLAKLLRIDPRPSAGLPYRVPGDNPFVVGGRRSPIYAYGLRNLWRFSFDRLTGDLVAADVGQNAVEEVNLRRRGQGRGANFGWSRCEGNQSYPGRTRPCPLAGSVRPVLERFHSDSDVCSITGGYVVRGRGPATLTGRYVYGDYCAPALRSAILDLPSARDDRELGLSVPMLTSFGEDAGGCIYVVSHAGTVYRLLGPAEAPPLPCAGPPADTRPPGLGVGYRKEQRAVAGREVIFATRCDEYCAMRGFGVLAIEGSGSQPRLGRTLRFAVGGERVRARLALSGDTRTRARRALADGLRVTARISARARDRFGNARTVTRSVEVVG